jgi:hypothetical protein
LEQWRTTVTAKAKRKPIVAIETTPYMVEARGDQFAVYQSWWNKDIELFNTREAAEEGLERIARAAGCWKRVVFR